MVIWSAFAADDIVETDWTDMHPAMQSIEVPAGTRVFEQGEIGDRMLLIADGEVQSSHRLPNGMEEPLSCSGAGDVVGEIALLTGSRRNATVIAMTPLRGWTLDRRGFDVLRWDPHEAAINLVRRLVALTTARLRANCARIAEPMAGRHDLSVSASGLRPVPAPAVEYLASLLCFEEFPHIEDVKTIVGNASVFAAERGEILIHEAAQNPSLLLVVHGAVEVTARQAGTTHRVRLAGPGRFLGHTAVLDDGPSPVLARCRERSVLLGFSRATVQALLADPARPSRAFSAAVLVDTARAIRQASRPVLATTAR